MIIDQGSGVIVRWQPSNADAVELTDQAPQLIVISNHHVAGDRMQWPVQLQDGRTLNATRLGTDPIGDITVLAFDDPPDDLPYAELARSAPPTGTQVWAIGNPFALAGAGGGMTVSTGVLSARNVPHLTYLDCHITDVSINPGNSGGPLFAHDGTLIGINGMINTRTGFRINSGIGYAISARSLQHWLPHLVSADGAFVRHNAVPDWIGTTIPSRSD